MEVVKAMTDHRRWALYLILILSGWWAAGYAARATSVSAPAHEGVDAAKLYHKYCAPCHGDRGDGMSRATAALDPPPRDFTTAKAAEELSRERMIVSATYGRPGTAMVGWKRRLSADQIEAIVDYIRQHFMKLPHAPAASSSGASPAAAPSARSEASQGAAGGPRPTALVDMSAPFPDGLKGNFDKGRDFFMHNCFTCHGKKGNGRGPRSKFMNPKPRNFLSADTRSRFNRPALFHAISKGVVGSVMPAWEKVLTPQQIANVAEFVFEAFVEGKGVGYMGTATAASDEEKKKAPSSDY